MKYNFNGIDTKLLFEIIKNWAENNIIIRAVWLFGSRIKGNARSNSDLDIALKLKDYDEITVNVDLSCLEKELQAYIEYKTGVKFNLQIVVYEDRQKSPTVTKGLKDKSVLVMRKYIKPQPPKSLPKCFEILPANFSFYSDLPSMERK